jgi:hypothetical protein
VTSETVQKELDTARNFGEQLEAIVVSKNYPTGDRNMLLLAYWELVSDFHRGIHALIRSGFFASAFALVRPAVESLVRAHVALKGSKVELQRLQTDDYRVNLEKIGPWIDAEFGLEGMMENFLNKRTREALHGYTHAGLHQLGRRFDTGYVKPKYGDDELVEVIRVATSAIFMLTILVTKHFGFEDDWNKVNALLEQWGKH